MDQAGVQPLLVGVLARQRGLDLVVGDDAAVLGVHEEHAARLEAPLAHHARGVQLEHAGLGGEHDQAVIGDGVAPWAQAVAVEHRSDERAVGEGDTRRPVPRLHEGGVELVEGPPRRVHLLVVLPGLGDHHEHRVRKGAAAEVQQLEHLVERGGVRGRRAADREEPLEVAGDDVGDQLALTRPHPVAVALDGVDLAVVGDHPVGVGQRPGGEGVRGEARVHQGQLAGEAPVREVGEEGLELAGGEHALVDHGARGQRREVDLGLPLGALAQAEREAVEADAHHPAGRRRHEELAEARHTVLGHLTHDLGFDRDLAPAEDPQPLLRGDGLDHGDRGLPLGLAGREEGGSHGIRPDDREVEVDDLAQERVGDLGEDARPVADQGVGAGRAPVLEVAQRGQGVVDDVVSRGAAQGRDHGHAAGVVLELAAVQPGVAGLGGEARGRHVGHRPWDADTLCRHRWQTPETRVDGLGHGIWQDSERPRSPTM